jgi:hypothetical protein
MNGEAMIITSTEGYSKGSDKRVLLKCDGCGKETTTTFNNYNVQQKRIGHTGETYCRKCSNKRSGEAKKGRPSPLKGVKRPHLSGENSASWKGGRWISSDGYWMVHIGNSNGKSKWGNYRKEHFVIAEEKIGRPLKKGEIVHHIDGDKLNNNLDNLDVLGSESEHRSTHNSFNGLMTRLVNQNIVLYKDGEYFINESTSE